MTLCFTDSILPTPIYVNGRAWHNRKNQLWMNISWPNCGPHILCRYESQLLYGTDEIQSVKAADNLLKEKVIMT
jgi:hypothetical protein